MAEGDGTRIIRCWKFLLIQFWQESSQSKYALEALYLLSQINALRTPCEAHELKWIRSVNNHGAAGCNVPLDLDLEHDNNYIKESLETVLVAKLHARLLNSLTQNAKSKNDLESMFRDQMHRTLEFL